MSSLSIMIIFVYLNRKNIKYDSFIFKPLKEYLYNNDLELIENFLSKLRMDFYYINEMAYRYISEIHNHAFAINTMIEVANLSNSEIINKKPKKETKKEYKELNKHNQFKLKSKFKIKSKFNKSKYN